MSSGRDYFLLLYLSMALDSIGFALESFDTLGVDWEAIDPELRSEPPRSAEIAIEEVKKNSDELWRCNLLASLLSNLDLKRRTFTYTAEIHEAIAQADVPAEMALCDGFDDEAIAICQDAFSRAYDQCGPDVKRLAAECKAEQALLGDPNDDDMLNAIRGLGFDPLEVNLVTIPAAELYDLLHKAPHLQGPPDPLGESAAGKAEATELEGDRGPYSDLCALASERMKGSQRKLVELLIGNGGSYPVADCKSEADISDFNSTRRHVNNKITKLGWEVVTHDGEARLRKHT